MAAATLVVTVNKVTLIPAGIAWGVLSYSTPASSNAAATPINAVTRSDTLSLSTTDAAYSTTLPAFATELWNYIVSERGIGGSCELRYNVVVNRTTTQGVIQDSDMTSASDIQTLLIAAAADAVTRAEIMNN